METLKTISQEDLAGKKLLGLDDTPGFGVTEMQSRFDAHPDENTRVINENANIQNTINADIDSKFVNEGTRLTSHISDIANPHSVTKSQVGLGNADNTSDINKPVSTAQGTAITNALNDSKSYTDTKATDTLTSANSYTDTGLALKADKANVLEKNNSVSYTPTQPYHPCTKDYADNLALQTGAVTSVFGRAGAVAAQSGDYTANQVGAEPEFAKNTAFNKNFGTTVGTVAEGDELAKKADTSKTISAIFLNTGWSAVAPYTQTVNVANVLSGDTPIIDVVLSDTPSIAEDELIAFLNTNRFDTLNGQIKATAYAEKPTTTFTIQGKVVY